MYWILNIITNYLLGLLNFNINVLIQKHDLIVLNNNNNKKKKKKKKN